MMKKGADRKKPNIFKTINGRHTGIKTIETNSNETANPSHSLSIITPFAERRLQVQ